MRMIGALLALLLAAPGGWADELEGVHWPSFRGPGASGISERVPTPTTWDLSTGRNIRWSTPLPGLGHSSPVIWGDRIYVTAALSAGEPELRVELRSRIAPVEEDHRQRWVLYCVDRNNGSILWQTIGHEGLPRIKRHPKGTHANSTPATDGNHIVTFFGSEGLFCFDDAGKRIWRNDLGELDAGFFEVPDAQWGFGSSPVIHGDHVFVQCDVQENSFVAAYTIEEGEEVWRTPRNDVPSWGTPTVYHGVTPAHIIVNGWRHIGAYDASTGAEVWKLRGGGDIPVPTPVIGHGLVFITNAHGGSAPLYAVRLTSRGDVTPQDDAASNDHVAWSVPRNGAYLQTPLVYGEFLYSCGEDGILKCYRAATGELIYKKRLGTGRTGFTASPVASRGKIYFTAENGDVLTLRSGPEFEVLATNRLDEICMATPAISEGMLLFRTRRRLVCVAESP